MREKSRAAFLRSSVISSSTETLLRAAIAFICSLAFATAAVVRGPPPCWSDPVMTWA
jgi:hypothetical protein